jgi:putative heme-binding domain-containing protein
LNRLHPTATTIVLRVLAGALLLGVFPHLARAQGATVPSPPQFAKTCALCHGNDAAGTDRAPALAGVAALRSMPDADIAAIISKGKGRMPAFPLPAADIDALTRYIRQLNISASDAKVIGDPKAGERLFFGDAHCSVCHMVLGQGTAFGPDLSTVGKRLKLSDLHQALVDPEINITPGYGQVMVTMKNGSKLHGFARAQGSHDLVLQTGDGKLHLLTEADYRSLVPDKTAAMPPFYGKADQQNDMVAYLSTLNGIGVGPLAGESAAAQLPVIPEEIDQVVHPKTGSWPTYNGTVDGNRNSRLTQVNLANAARLQLQWSYTIPYFGLETTPVVVDGVMFVTGNNQVFAISGRTGREIWRYERPKSPAATISGDAAIGVNRGVAVLGDRVFYLTDDAHLIALHRLTGALLWDVDTPEGAKGSSMAERPLRWWWAIWCDGRERRRQRDSRVRRGVQGHHGRAGVEVYDHSEAGRHRPRSPIHGRVRRWGWAAAQPGPPAAPTRTPASIVYWPSAIPHPDTDGDERRAQSLHQQRSCYRPEDGQAAVVLPVHAARPARLGREPAHRPGDTAKWKGKPRKLLLHANRNGFLYVLDRTNGKPLLATRMVDTLNWASGIDPQTGAGPACPRMRPR